MDARNEKLGPAGSTLRFLCYWATGSGSVGSDVFSDFAEIQPILSQLEFEHGSLDIYRYPAPEVGPQLLKLTSDGRAYLLTLGELTASDYDVRVFDNGSDPQKLAEFCGELYPAHSLFSDFQIAMNAIRGYFEVGDVSHHLLR